MSPFSTHVFLSCNFYSTVEDWWCLPHLNSLLLCYTSMSCLVPLLGVAFTSSVSIHYNWVNHSFSQQLFIKRQWCINNLWYADWKEKEKRATEDKMVGCHHRLNGHVFEQTPGDGEGQGSLVCCSSWDHKGSDKTECWTATTTMFQLLNWVLIIKLRFFSIPFISVWFSFHQDLLWA